MSEESLANWVARIRDRWRAAGRDGPVLPANDLDGHVWPAIWLRVRGFFSLLREIIFR